MKIFAGSLIAVLFSLAYTAGHAQTGYATIRGKILTNNSAPADAATVVLLRSKDSSVVQSTIAGNDGVFAFTGHYGGSYLLFITKLGYAKQYAGPYPVVQNKNTDAGDIILLPQGTQLEAVTIAGRKDFVEVHPDKTVLNVDRNIMAAGTSLYDVLTTSPGVKVLDDQILYKGGQKALIAIDGKPVLFTGDELATFLKNYQSSSISRIELIDNAGSKYGASGSGGMINIILKKNVNLGSNFGITQSAAYGQDYKFATGLIYTLRTEKLNLYASYGFQDNKVPHTITNNRYINTAGQLYNFDLNYNAAIKNVNNNFNIGADYDIAKGHQIGFLVSGFFNDIDFNKKNVTDISTNGVRDSSINTRSDINRNIKNFTYDLNYKGNLDKAGHSVLSADAEYSDYNRSSNELLQNDYFNAAGQMDGSLFYQDNSPSHITIKSANIDFSQELSKTSHFSLGVKSSRVNSDNQIDFNQLVNDQYQSVPDLTDHFIYNERINAAYAGFETRFDKTTVSVNLRDEQTRSRAFSINPNREVDTTYNNLFPNIQVTRQLDKNNLLTAFYTRTITRPNYQDLNPFVGYVDQFYYSTGNPFLKPEYVNTYQVSDMFKDKYKLSASFVVTNDFFNTIFEQDNVTKIYTTTKANLGTRYQYLLELNLPVDIAPWWNVNTDITFFHERYAYKLDTVEAKSTNGVNIYLNQEFKITRRLTAQWYNSFESAAYYAISNYRTLYFMNAGLSYSVLNNKGSIKLAATDIFNTNYNYYHTNYANLDITQKEKLGSRFIMATFTYHFGTSSPKANSNTSNEEKRLGGSSNEN